MKFKAVTYAATAALALGLCISQANAAGPTFPALAFDNTGSASIDLSNANVAQGSFTDYFRFSVGGASDTWAAVVTDPTYQSISGLTLALDTYKGGTYTPVADMAALTSDVGYRLASNTNYAFVVSGSAGEGGGSYVGGASVSAVPLPAALPMFGAALLGLGGLARRRKAAKAA